MNELEQLARDEANRYAREWRAKNRDKKAAANRRYWERRALKHLAEQQDQEENHGERD